MEMENQKHILVEKGEGWVLFTLNRPKVLNALNRELLQELDERIRWAEQAEDVKVVIITGSGEKAFAAGADIQELRQIASAHEAEKQALIGQAIFNRIEQLPKPVIMAVNGYALGGGCELAMCGDFILASENAKFGQPEVNLGIIPGYGGTQRLARLVGEKHAKYLCMTGEMISAEEALRLGLVQKVLPAGQLLTEAKKIAEQLVKKPALALHFIKKSIHNGLKVDLETGLQMEASYFGIVFQTEDRIEGMDAFLQKREANFKGK
jgi:enoyl-CoA hydratase